MDSSLGSSGPLPLGRSVYISVSILLSFVIENRVLNANSVNPDQPPHFAASDLGLHCLPMSL